ncbi:hypothetical protein M436DRAFT_79628 [Aureobasidium namibiae CBS 147.97]|uniref:Uncharacterized protein n=1 Tax=Aureobasidium namibiae CBS 147.97 TaxID=1043004 RepID=A0A074WPX5_9PEZI
MSDQPPKQDVTKGKTRGPAYPLINPNANLEAQFKRTYHEMLDLTDQSRRKPRRSPTSSCRTVTCQFSTALSPTWLVLAQGHEDCLLHAEKAVEIAEWGLNEYGNDKGVGSELLAFTQRILGEVQARPVQEEEETHEIEAHEQEGSAAGESAQGQGQESAAPSDAPSTPTSDNITAPSCECIGKV